MKKWVSIDLDGIVCDYVPGFLAYASNETGVDIRDFVPSNYKSFYEDVGRLTGCTDMKYVNQGFLYNRGLMYLKPVDGALEGIERFRSLDYKILLNTTREGYKDSEVKRQTEYWLREHDVKYDRLEFTPYKPQPIDRVNAEGGLVVCHVEDNQECALSVASHGTPVCLFRYEHNAKFNSGMKLIVKMDGWKALMENFK